MRLFVGQLCLAFTVTFGIVGCGPKPVAEDRPLAEDAVHPERSILVLTAALLET